MAWWCWLAGLEGFSSGHFLCFWMSADLTLGGCRVVVSSGAARGMMCVSSGAQVPLCWVSSSQLQAWCLAAAMGWAAGGMISFLQK